MPEAVPHIEELARFTEQAFEKMKATLGAGMAADANDRASSARPPRSSTSKPVRPPAAKLPALARKASRKVPATRKIESDVRRKAHTAGAT
jgi:hypothetical protein